MTKQVKTVGEMIASLHWRDAFEVAKKDSERFQSTDVGRAYIAYTNAHFNAVQKDSQEHISDKALTAAWDKADEAGRVLVTHIKRLIDSARQRRQGVE